MYLGSAAAEKFAQIWGDSVTSVAAAARNGGDGKMGRSKDAQFRLQRANRQTRSEKHPIRSYKYIVLRCLVVNFSIFTNCLEGFLNWNCRKVSRTSKQAASG